MDKIRVMREAAIYFVLVVVISSVLVMQIYKTAQDAYFYVAFDRHAAAMDRFLEGWTKYDKLVGESEVILRDQATWGVIPPFSCEAVFIRRHIVEVN